MSCLNCYRWKKTSVLRWKTKKWTQKMEIFAEFFFIQRQLLLGILHIAKVYILPAISREYPDRSFILVTLWASNQFYWTILYPCFSFFQSFHYSVAVNTYQVLGNNKLKEKFNTKWVRHWIFLNVPRFHRGCFLDSFPKKF